MAKIERINLVPLTDSSGNLSKAMVDVEISFHPLEVQLDLEYILHLFVVSGQRGTVLPKVFCNWDTAHIEVYPISDETTLLGQFNFTFKASKQRLQLVKRLDFHHEKKRQIDMIRANASLVSQISPASRWSNEYLMEVQLR